ncbi:unnamed protein product [Paramecium primaurelia]|uniref:Transmembrane protein n=1 Tax=Paramecium primaurelia TaxID=5886 RepID=A0A8S1M646_PARPR|nr:unnamed protein product [Paramecium primaurelia]
MPFIVQIKKILEIHQIYFFETKNAKIKVQYVHFLCQSIINNMQKTYFLQKLLYQILIKQILQKINKNYTNYIIKETKYLNIIIRLNKPLDKIQLKSKRCSINQKQILKNKLKYLIWRLIYLLKMLLKINYFFKYIKIKKRIN